MPYNFEIRTPFSSFWKENSYYVLDQIILPSEIKYIKCDSPADVAKTISNMNLRGAPLIGAAASAGIALFFQNNNCVENSFESTVQLLLNTRPTAVNLKNVLDESVMLYRANKSKKRDELFSIFKTFSDFVHFRDKERNFKMGENGAEYLSEIFKGRKLNVLTHCNAGSLATCGYGTALGVVRSLHRRNILNHVWVDETRPYLQGARLTAFEMVCENISHSIITDSTAAWLMHEKKVDVVITGADRVAANGDLANKIGTYSLAVNSRFHNIPFISVMPLETFDMSISDGRSIIIEERNDKELLNFNGKRIAHLSSSGLHLGFDVVPAGLVSALVTEKGVVVEELSQNKIFGLFNEIA